MKKTYKINLPKGMTIKPGSIGYCYDNDSLDISVELEKEKYKPKDGDFVYYGAGLIGIFKEFVDKNHKDYVTLIGDTLLPYECTWINDKLRPATEREKKILIDKLAEVGKRWNPETKAIEDVRWRAKKEDVYYYIIGGDNDFVIASAYDMRILLDERRYNVGNYFKTHEAAEKAAEQIREIFRNSKAE